YSIQRWLCKAGADKVAISATLFRRSCINLIDIPSCLCDVLPYYGRAHQQKERQQTLLLRRRERPRGGQAPHRATDLPRNSRPISRSVKGTHGSGSAVGDNAGVRSARSAVAGRSA